MNNRQRHDPQSMMRRQNRQGIAVPMNHHHHHPQQNRHGIVVPMNHPTHDQHPVMRLIRSDEAARPFKCSGCKELGFGPRYQCATTDCPFKLHERCFLARPRLRNQLQIRPFMGINYRFQFRYHPPPPVDVVVGPNRRLLSCDACGEEIKGFRYHGEYWGHVLDLHPCCMNLGSTMRDPNNGMTLILKNKMPTNTRCVRCYQRRNNDDDNEALRVRGWSYVSSCGNYGYHVYCVKKLIMENWGRVHNFYNVGNHQAHPREMILMNLAIIGIGVIISAVFGN